MRSKKLFIILSIQRSGSTYFRTWLNSHTDIRCHEELFLADYKAPESFHGYVSERFLGRRIIRSWTELKTLDGFLANRYIKDFLNALLSNSPPGTPMTAIERDSVPWNRDETCSAKWVGIKLMADQLLAAPSLAAELHKKRVHVINLVRQNCLDNYVSRKVAEQRGIYHSTKKLPPVCLELDPDSTVKEIRQIQRKFSEARHQFKSCPELTIFYEHFFDEQRQPIEMQRVMEFLGLSAAGLGPAPGLKKVVNQPVEQAVKNYEQIAERIAREGLQ